MAAAPNATAGLHMDPKDSVLHLPLILAQIFHALTRKRAIIGSGLERCRRNHLPSSCRCVLSELQAFCRCNRVSFAKSGQVRWGILMASSMVPEDHQRYKSEALALSDWQYISKARNQRQIRETDTSYSDNVGSSNLLTTCLHSYLPTISLFYEKKSLL